MKLESGFITHFSRVIYPGKIPKTHLLKLKQVQRYYICMFKNDWISPTMALAYAPGWLSEQNIEREEASAQRQEQQWHLSNGDVLVTHNDLDH